MKIAITGGTGFIGGCLARELKAGGHAVVIIGRPGGRTNGNLAEMRCIGLDDPEKLRVAFAGCDAVAHCAGINREIGRQTYQRVHVEGTRNVVSAARAAGVGKLVYISFLRARPACGSPYHESKWAAEEEVRQSGLNFTIVKPGVVYGKGDHMLDHLSHAFHTFPVFALVGMKDQPVRPMSVTDLTRVLRAALVEGRLARQTVAVVGPELMTLREAVERVAEVVGRRPVMFPLPLIFHYALAHLLEFCMRTPLVALAQVRILAEGVVEPLPRCEFVPADLAPQVAFTREQIRCGLPAPQGFGLRDLRCCRTA